MNIINEECVLEESWKNEMGSFLETKSFVALTEFVKSEYNTKHVFPEPENIFKAFSLTPFYDVKVVILGQDPYHDDGQAHGLSFSVPDDVPVPPSLKNIYKEIEQEYGISKSTDLLLRFYIKNNPFISRK
jgi:uracil-DNA glycosylase